jgi:hypothetical protein
VSWLAGDLTEYLIAIEQYNEYSYAAWVLLDEVAKSVAKRNGISTQ